MIKKEKVNKKSKASALNYPDKDFIPYASYFNESTILTKNGDLLKTIKIPSFINTVSDTDLFDIRQKIREVIETKHIHENISFWFQTVRKQVSIMPHGKYDNGLSYEIGEKWRIENQWDRQYVNEIFISVIISPNRKTIFNPFTFLSTLSFLNIRKQKFKQFLILEKILNKVVLEIVKNLEEYGSMLLKIKKSADNVYYSQHMKFFSLLLNLEKSKFPIRCNDISNDLVTKKIAFGNHNIKTAGKEKKKYATIISFKDYTEISAAQLDKILQLPQEFVITQTASYTNGKFIHEQYKEQVKMLELSEDDDFAFLTGLDNIINTDKVKKTSFCAGQITIMPINNTSIGLERNLKSIYSVFNSLGIIAIREGLSLSTCFWSQLPANFSFVHRINVIPSSIVAGFSSLYNFPIGKLRNNTWGNAVTVFKTALNTPYFFNFHYDDNGHTFIVGSNGSGKTTMMNFLISESRKICKKLFYIDCNRSSEVFINSLNGKYYQITGEQNSTKKILKLNILSLLKKPEDLEFLSNWLTNLVCCTKTNDQSLLKKEETIVVEKECKNIYKILKANAHKIKTLSDLIAVFNLKTMSYVYKKLLMLQTNKGLSLVMNNEKEISFKDNIIGIDLSLIAKNKNSFLPVVDYIINKIILTANNEPCIVAIDNAWQIFDSNFFGEDKLKDILLRFAQKNIAMIITTKGSQFSKNSYIPNMICDYFGTEIFLHNSKPSPYQRKVFGLEEEEAKLLKVMKPEARNFLLKSRNDIVIASLNLKSFNEILNVLSNTNVSINAMKKAKTLVKSERSEDWLPVFLKIIAQYNKQVKERMLLEQEKMQEKWEESHSTKNSQTKIIKGK